MNVLAKGYGNDQEPVKCKCGKPATNMDGLCEECWAPIRRQIHQLQASRRENFVRMTDPERQNHIATALLSVHSLCYDLKLTTQKERLEGSSPTSRAYCNEIENKIRDTLAEAFGREPY